jgi:hypothetical protein
MLEPLFVPAPPLPPRTSDRPGAVPPALLALVTKSESATVAPIALMPAVIRDVQLVTDETFLRRVIRVLSHPELAGVRDMVFRHAVDLAIDSGASWTPALDAIADILPGRDEPAALGREWLPCYHALASWMADVAGPGSSTTVHAFRSRPFRWVRARHLALDGFDDAAFDAIAAQSCARLVWRNPRVTPGQRDRLVATRVERIAARRAQGEHGISVLAFLADFTDAPRVHRDAQPWPAPVRPSDASLAVLAEAVLPALRSIRTVTGHAVDRTAYSDTLMLLHIPDLPPAVVVAAATALQQRAGGALSGGVGGLLIRQRRTTAAFVAGLVRTGAIVSPGEVCDGLEARADVIWTADIQSVLPGRVTGGLQRLLTTTCAPERFPEHFQTLVRVAPRLAVALIDAQEIPAGAVLDPAWLIPLLEHRTRSIRLTALVAAGRLPRPAMGPRDDDGPSARVPLRG